MEGNERYYYCSNRSNVMKRRAGPLRIDFIYEKMYILIWSVSCNWRTAENQQNFLNHTFTSGEIEDSGTESHDLCSGKYSQYLHALCSAVKVWTLRMDLSLFHGKHKVGK